MKLMACLLLSASLFFSVPGSAFTPDVYFKEAREASLRGMTLSALNWKVGDMLRFKITMKPLSIKGSSVIRVVQIADEGILTVQDVGLGFLGNQHIETLIDKHTGQVLRIVVNGEEEDVPEVAGTKILKQEGGRITVPAGTFDCLHILMEDGKKRRTELWVNPMALPINGLLKSVEKKMKPFTTTTELVSFERGQ